MINRFAKRSPAPLEMIEQTIVVETPGHKLIAIRMRPEYSSIATIRNGEPIIELKPIRFEFLVEWPGGLDE